MVFQKSITKKIETTDTKRPNIPQITIKNPLDKTTFVNGIELLLEPEFAQKGKIVILINDVSVFDENDSEGFFGYAKFPIPLNKSLKRSNDIKIYAWNGIDSNQIRMRLNAPISENPEPFQSQAVPLSQDVFNKVVNKAENVFDLVDYENETATKIIDTVGRPNMIIMIAASNPTIPEPIDFLSQWNGIDDMNDLNLGSANEVLVGITSSDFLTVGTKREILFDFGVATNRKVGWRANWQTGTITVLTGTLTMSIRILESPDNVSYTELDILSASETMTGGSVNLQFNSNKQPKPDSRYFKIRFDVNSAPSTFNQGSDSIPAVFEFYDYARAFGTAELSFEVLEENTQQWIPYIKATDIGTISTGQAVTKQVGSTIVDDPATGKFNKFIPSTQTNFRAKLVVTNAIQTAVSIITGG